LILPGNSWREAEFKALQSLLLEKKVRYFVTASRTSFSLFFPSLDTPSESGSASYLLPHLTSTLTLTLFLLFFFSSLFLLPTPNSYNQPTHSTICFLHSLALTVGSLISIQSSRQINLVTPSAPTPLDPPASNQPYSSGFVQVCLPDPVLSCKAHPKRPGTALDACLNVDHDADFDTLRLPISPTHTALDLAHSNSQHQR
jgi:hypothetical protein